MVGIFFVILALLWLLREPKFVKGWSSIFSSDANNQRYIGVYLHMRMTSMLIANVQTVKQESLDESSVIN